MEPVVGFRAARDTSCISNFWLEHANLEGFLAIEKWKCGEMKCCQLKQKVTNNQKKKNICPNLLKNKNDVKKKSYLVKQ